MANVTAPTEQSPAEFLTSVEPLKRRQEGERLLALMSEVTGADPFMWGPSMIGFGTYRYCYPSGRKGEFFRVGFSPRKSALSLYGLKDDERAEAMLADLGPHTTGAGCVYVKKLDAVDEAVLRKLVKRGFERPKLHEA
ncbi:DUF1801 domain-containing protein [Demequina sp.]|uniref:DUF1801 domain-containing protein n=1 Tax=Demequina sp. TaxID=2050685 RepID=UPI0025C16E5C|nr:DUF1801 domain-containing protein [Demequina sp.]